MALILPQVRSYGTAEQVIWGPIVPGDTWDPVLLNDASLGMASIQIIGTFGGATCGMQVSNDRTNWVSVKDWSLNTVIAMTATGLQEFTSGALWAQPVIAGGAAYTLTFIMGARG